MKQRKIYMILISIITVLFLSSCHVGYPFRGPGFDAEKDRALLWDETEVLVAITHGVVDNDGKRAFSQSLENVRKSMLNSPGLIGYSVRKQLFGNEVWTMSAWVSEEALYDFVSSPAHTYAVERGGISPDAVRSVYVWVPANRLPLSWDVAMSYLDDMR